MDATQQIAYHTMVRLKSFEFGREGSDDRVLFTMVRLESLEFGRERSDDRVLFFDPAREGSNCCGLFSDGAISADRLAAVLGPIDPMRMLLAQQRAACTLSIVGHCANFKCCI